MIYREAVRDDIPRLAQMRWDFRVELHHEPIAPEAKAPFMQVMLDFLAEAFDSGMWGIWVAEEDGVIVSNVYIQRIRKVPRPIRLNAEMGYLTNMFTYPAFRGKGIGAELLRYALEWARSRRLETIILWPAEGREEFYMRGGFEREKEAMTQEL